MKLTPKYKQVAYSCKVVTVLTVTAIAITKAIIPTIMKAIPRPLAKSGPTEDILRQCGHRANALFNVLN